MVKAGIKSSSVTMLLSVKTFCIQACKALELLYTGNLQVCVRQRYKNNASSCVYTWVCTCLELCVCVCREKYLNIMEGLVVCLCIESLYTC